jgi:hypothetical protein
LDKGELQEITLQVILDRAVEVGMEVAVRAKTATAAVGPVIPVG